MKKILCVVSIIIIMCIQIISVYAADVVDRENGYIEIGDRVTILNEAGLKYFANQVNSGNKYKGKVVSLSADLDLQNELWTPIGFGDREYVKKGMETPQFSGVFDGYGHSIKNLNIDCGDYYYCAGLFGTVVSGQVKNLVVESGSIKNESGTAGTIVGTMMGDTNVIANCIVKEGVTVESNSSGGVVGRVQGNTNYVYNCENYATIVNVGDKAKGGGILCLTENNSIVVKNKNYATVTGGISGAGGIAGYANANGFFSLNENFGEVKEAKYSGGIIGYATGNGGYVVNCYNEADMDATSSAGGIVGIITAEYNVQDSLNKGNITSATTGESNIGGITGDVKNGTLLNCENQGQVIGAKCAGGVSGTVGKNGTIKYCKGGTSTVKGNTYSGRILGHVATATASSGATVVGDAHLFIDDNNGDDYTDLGTTGGVAINTGHASVTIEDGTFHGKPYANINAKILFLDGTKWDGVDESKNCYFGTKKNNAPSNDWELRYVYSNIEDTVEATTVATGTRTYQYGTDTITSVLPKKAIVWTVGNEVNTDNGTKIEFTGNDNSSKVVELEEISKLEEKTICIDPTENECGITIKFSPDTNSTQAVYVSRLQFETNGGDEIESAEIENEGLNLPKNYIIKQEPVKKGFEFDGWYTDKELTKPVTEDFEVLGNAKVYAKWTEIKEEDKKDDDKKDDELEVDVDKKDENVVGKPEDKDDNKTENKPTTNITKPTTNTTNTTKPTDTNVEEKVENKTETTVGAKDEGTTENTNANTVTNTTQTENKVESKKEESNLLLPKTGDGIVKFVVIAVIAGGALVFFKKKGNK